MNGDLDELIRVVGTMPREMAREVLNFARHLQRTQARAGDESADWADDLGSRYGSADGPGGYHPWDAADTPGVKDVA